MKPTIPSIEIVSDGEARPWFTWVGGTLQVPAGQLRDSAGVDALLRPVMGGLDQEVFVALLLNSKHRLKPNGCRIISVGTLTASLCHPREVFRPAVHAAAAGIILAHNHPSGEPEPSAEDRELTKRLREAGEILGIRVLDHVILGADRHWSFVDAGQW
jgi:DNA repair protein RadC